MNDTTTLETPLNFTKNDKDGLPSMLNVLTILTFIGCAFDLYTGIKNFIMGQDNLDKLKKAQENLDQMPVWARKFVGPEVMELAQKAIENRVPLLILSLLAVGLCVFGAIEMRKLKKQGYILWLVGEVIPFIGSLIFTGLLFFKTPFVYFLIIPIIFIILYTSQKKYLIKQ
jgi:hypothetical protein